MLPTTKFNPTLSRWKSTFASLGEDVALRNALAARGREETARR